MTAYEDPSGKLRSIAYPDNHQGYGRIQLDQVIDTRVREGRKKVETMIGRSDDERALRWTTHKPHALTHTSVLPIHTHAHHWRSIDRWIHHHHRQQGRFTLLAYGTQDPTDTRFRQMTKQGNAHEYKLRISNSTRSKPRALRVTLAWTDRPGSATSCSKTRQSVLTNDLDLVVTGPKVIR